MSFEKIFMTYLPTLYQAFGSGSMISSWLAAFAYEYDDLYGHVEEDDFPVGVLGNITFGQAEEFAQLFNVGPVDKRCKAGEELTLFGTGIVQLRTMLVVNETFA